MTVTRARRLAGAVIPVAAGIVLVSSVAGCKATVAAVPAASEPVSSVSVQSGVSTPTSVSTPASVSAPSSAAAVATDTADPASASAPADSSSAAGSSAPASGGTGSGALSVSITSPVTVAGSVAAPVSCVAGDLSYRAAVSGTSVNGNEITFSVAIARYRGPGSYPAVVAASLREPSGTVTAIGGASRVPALITSTGGSFTVSAVGSAGRTFTGSLAWTCA